MPIGGFTAACWLPGTPGHSWQATACGEMTAARKGMVLAARVLAASAWDLCRDPALVAAAKEDFRGRVAGQPYAPLVDRDLAPPLTYHDLHDGVGQSLSLLVSGLKTAHATIADPDLALRCRHLLDLAQTALKDVRRLSLGLRPSMLDDLGLAAALERLVADVREHHPVGLALDTEGLAGARLSVRPLPASRSSHERGSSYG